MRIDVMRMTRIQVCASKPLKDCGPAHVRRIVIHADDEMLEIVAFSDGEIAVEMVESPRPMEDGR